MANTANIKAVITADDKASSVLKKFGDSVGSLGSAVTTGLKYALEGITAAAAATTAFGVSSVKAFSESQDLIAQTEAVIKSTGGAAKVTADQVTELATALQKQTKFSDEDIRSAENLLLTFTNIGTKIFPQTTEAVLDMSTALGQDLKSSAIQLGKALQDPVLGVTALRRVGVNFSDSQREVIKNLIESGQSLKAQQLILKEIRTEFGGSAKAAGDTFSGALQKLKNSLNDVQEKVGQVIVTRLTPFITKALQAVAAVDWDKVINRSIAALNRFIDVIKRLHEQFFNVYHSVFNYLQPGIERFAQTIINFAKIVYDWVMPSLRAWLEAIETRLLPQIKELWNAIEPGFTTALQFLAKVLGGIVIGALWLSINVATAFITVLGGVVRAFNDVVKWAGTAGNFLLNVFRDVYNFFTNSWGKNLYTWITTPFFAAFRAIAALWNNTVGKLHFDVPSWVPGMGGHGFSVPNIPMLAEGGIVKARPGGTLAVLGEGGQDEAVVPLNRTNGMVFPSAVNITIQAGAFMGTDIEARKFAKVIWQHLQDMKGMKNQMGVL